MADRIKGITIEVGGDTTGLNKALDGTNKEIRNTQSQLKDVERLLKLDPSNTELLRQKQRLLSDAVKETGDKLETLKTAEKQVQQQFKEGKISQEQYDALKREIIATEQQLEKLEDQAKQSNVILQKISLAGEKVQEFGDKVTAAGQELSKVSAGLAAVGAAGVAAWETVDEAYDTIAKGTGATGEVLEDLQKSFDNVFSSIPTDASTAGSAIADINTRFGFTGEVLEDCTRKFIRFSAVNSTDVSTAIANVSRYMGDAGIESDKYGEVLDQLTAASQASGLGVDKLSDSLTKYGAPMRALGLTTQESIAILAGWEKAGVNTEIAFSGMKKAIGTWGKAGKDASQEFKKTLEEIAAAPDIAKATTKAIEVFGQKAGPDLADAIQGGRFEYEDFLEVIEKSEGQLEQTFNDTLSPIDDVKVAVQGLTAQGAKLGGSLLKTLSPMITKLVSKLKELTSWFDGLNDSQKESVVKIGLLVAAAGPMLIVIGQIITGIGGMMTMVSTVGPAIGALSAAGGPILLTVAAVGALGAAFLAARNDAKKYYDRAVELTGLESENKKKVDELYSAYESMNQRRNDAADNAEAEALKEQELFAALQDITDENGNVQDGYEERAKYILGELSTALGQEYTLTGNQIQNYKDMCTSIDDLILKKQANALMDANAEAYAEALKNRTDAFMEYNEAQKNVEETTRKLEEAQQREALLQEDLNALRESGIAHMLGLSNESAYLAAKVKEASETTNGYKEKLAELDQTLLDAETSYVGYKTVISNQDMLLKAKDNQDLLAEAVLMASNSFQTAESSTKDSLERQLQTFTEKYEAMQEAVKAGAPGITQAQVDEMAHMVDLSKQELEKMPSAAEQAARNTMQAIIDGNDGSRSAGSEFMKDYADGIAEGEPSAREAGKEAARSTMQAIIDGNDGCRSAGSEFSRNYASGISEGETDVKTSAEQIAYMAENGIKVNTRMADAWGSDMMDGYIQGITSKISDLDGVCRRVAGTVSDYLHFTRPEKGPLRYYEEWMPHMMQGLAKGIAENVGTVGTAALGAAGKIGEELAAGIADGVRKNKDNVKKNAEDLAKSVLSAAQQKIKNEQVYRKLSLADEMDYWESVRRQVTEGTQARIEADEKYFKAKQDLNKKSQAAEEKYTDNVAKAYENLNKEIKSLNKEYRDAVDSRASEIQNAYGLFDEFSTDTDLTSGDLLNNLQSQVDGLDEWRSNLVNLAGRGIGDDLLAELQDLGPQSAAQIRLLTQMTDDQLDQYVSLFRQKNRIARKQAVEELAPMRNDIAAQIVELKSQTARELADYQKQYMESMTELGVAMNRPAENMKLIMAQNAVEMVSGLASSIQTEAGNTENTEKFKAIANNILNATGTLQADMQGVGQNAMDGIIVGLQNREAELYAAAQGIAQRVTQVMQDTFQIHSPSAVMREKIGKNLMLGLRDGMEKYKKLATSAVHIGMNITGTTEGNGNAGQAADMSGVMDVLNAYLPEIAQQKYITLNGKTLVGQTVSEMNCQLVSTQAVQGRNR